MNTVYNARSRNTERNLEEAYLELLKANHNKQVSVMELCRKVHVNRATFYAHYSDVFDLQERIEKRISAEVSAIFKDPELGEMVFNQKKFKAVLEYVKENRLFYQVWFSSGRMDDPRVLMLHFNNSNMTDERLYKVLYHKAGLNAVIRQWVSTGCEKPIGEVVLTVSELYKF